MESETRKAFWKSATIPTWGCFLLATLTVVLAIIWRMHDKGTNLQALWASGWAASLSIFLPSIIIAGAVLAAAIFNYKAHHQEQVPAQPAGQGKLKWQKLQWCNAERERLEGEVKKWKDMYDSKNAFRGLNDAFGKPPSEIVSGSVFINQSLEVDGKSFRDCEFTNVTFTYNGTGPTDFTGCVFHKSITLESLNQAVIEFSQLQKALRSIPGGEIGRDGPVDARGHLLSDKFRIEPVPPNFTPLQIETLNLARDLQLFHKNTEPAPLSTNWPDTVDGQRQFIVKNCEWSEQLGHAYVSGGFAERVTKLVHKLGAKKINVSALEQFCKWVGSEDNVTSAIKALWTLAEEMEQQ
jgi:hypothetical protein